MTTEQPTVLVSVRLPLLQVGSEGRFVQRLQALLNVVIEAGLDIDGILGPLTEAAVRQFQAASHILVDGIVGAQTWEALIAIHVPLAAITVRQPQPFDLVGGAIDLCGIGTGFEAIISARALDHDGAELTRTSLRAGGNGILDQFQGSLALAGRPATTRGSVEVFERSARDGSPINTVAVPVFFGTAIVDGYLGFIEHVVQGDDTLSALAERFYGDASKLGRMFEANRHLIDDPDLIFPGQVLRIPASSDLRE